MLDSIYALKVLVDHEDFLIFFFRLKSSWNNKRHGKFDYNIICSFYIYIYCIPNILYSVYYISILCSIFNQMRKNPLNLSFSEEGNEILMPCKTSINTSHKLDCRCLHGLFLLSHHPYWNETKLADVLTLKANWSNVNKYSWNIVGLFKVKERRQSVKFENCIEPMT